MSNLKVLSKAEAARKKVFDLRQALSTRSGTPPEVEDLLPPLPGDNVKKLQAARQGTDCKVIITSMVVPPGSTPGDTYIALQKDSVVVTEWVEGSLPPASNFRNDFACKGNRNARSFSLDLCS